MAWVRIASLPGDLDCRELNQALEERAIAHRFVAEGDAQVLWVADAAHFEIASQLLERFLAGEELGSADISAPDTGSSRLVSARAQGLLYDPAPLTLALLFCSITGFLAVNLGPEYVAPLTFYDIGERMFVPDVYRDIRAGEWWRLWTPAFLHFNVLHIVFNGLWLWYLGSRVERVYGWSVLLGSVAVIALVSNVAQAEASGPVVFGGMSGVVFGLLALTWLSFRLSRHPGLALPPGLIVVMVAFMLLSITGIFDLLAGGEVADTAHISGFLTGLALALVLRLLPLRTR